MGQTWGSSSRSNMSVQVHPLTESPTACWKKFKSRQKVLKLEIEDPKEPITQDKVRFVCMADTHSFTHKMQFTVPDGDVFIHAGDFTQVGHPAEVRHFDEWLGKLPHKHKLVIAGNHELSFDSTVASYGREAKTAHIRTFLLTLGAPEDEAAETVKYEEVRSLLSNCTYLEDSTVEISGLKIYGTPWQPEFGDWAFNLPRGQSILEKWNQIPSDTDILITHGPPIGHGDLTVIGARAGCVELLSTVQQRVKPKFHIFGHIHEAQGVTTDGATVYINASTCTRDYLPVNKPIVFDVPVPPGVVKE